MAEETLQAHLTADALRNLASSAFFCPYPTCEVLYFDAFERHVAVEAVLKPVYPKDPDAPICGCFGLTPDDIERDLDEGSVTRVKELLAKAKSPAAHCRTAAASGQSCVPEVQRYFMQRRAARANG